MAERMTYEVPSRPVNGAAEHDEHLEELAGRLEELNGLLDVLYERGVIRLLTDLVQAAPEISEILLRGLNTEGGRSGLRNLIILIRQFGRIEPERLERMLQAVDAGFDRIGEPLPADGPYPPGITGAIRLLRDEKLWRALGPVLEGAKAFTGELAGASGRGEGDGPGS